MPAVEMLPQSWVTGEDALILTADYLSPPITTVPEMSRFLSFIAPALANDFMSPFLNYLHQVNSILHFSQHNILRNFVFPSPQFVVDLLKSLYRHNMKSLTLSSFTEPTSSQSSTSRPVSDAEFERMKSDLTENGTVSVDFLRLAWSRYCLQPQHYELLLILMLKFDLVYPKCKDADTHSMITELIAKTTPCTQSQLYSTLKGMEEVRNRPVDPLRNHVIVTLGGFVTRKFPEKPVNSNPQPLLSALESSGSYLLLPWFVPESKPSSVPDVSSSSSNCVQIVSTYAFRYSVPLGLFDRLASRSSRHSVYTRHWKSGLYFHYGPVTVLFNVRSIRPLPAISLAFRTAKSLHNLKSLRLCHVMWRCIEDMESLLLSMPGAAVNRYISRAALKQDDPLEVAIGARHEEFSPVCDGPVFHVQQGAATACINEDMLFTLQDGEISVYLALSNIIPVLFLYNVAFNLVANDPIVSEPLHKVFAARVGDELTDEQIHAVSRGIQDRWVDVADRLFLPEDVIDELSESGSAATRPRRMLKKLRELMPDSAKVCVLCDALNCSH